jgi:hypothetical protein
MSACCFTDWAKSDTEGIVFRISPKGSGPVWKEWKAATVPGRRRCRRRYAAPQFTLPARHSDAQNICPLRLSGRGQPHSWALVRPICMRAGISASCKYRRGGSRVPIRNDFALSFSFPRDRMHPYRLIKATPQPRAWNSRISSSFLPTES